jgi:hypothetical protein
MPRVRANAEALILGGVLDLDFVFICRYLPWLREVISKIVRSRTEFPPAAPAWEIVRKGDFLPGGGHHPHRHLPRAQTTVGCIVAHRCCPDMGGPAYEST